MSKGLFSQMRSRPATDLKRTNEKIFAIVIDGAVTGSIIKSEEETGCQVLRHRTFRQGVDEFQGLRLDQVAEMDKEAAESNPLDAR